MCQLDPQDPYDKLEREVDARLKSKDTQIKELLAEYVYATTYKAENQHSIITDIFNRKVILKNILIIFIQLYLKFYVS